MRRGRGWHAVVVIGVALCACVSCVSPEGGVAEPATERPVEPVTETPVETPVVTAPAPAVSHAASRVPDVVREHVGGPGDSRVRALLDEVRAWTASGRRPAESDLSVAPLLASNAAPWLYDAPHLLVAVPTPADREEWQQAMERLGRVARLLRAVRERVDEVVADSVPRTTVSALPGALPVFVVPDRAALASWQHALGEPSMFPAAADYVEAGAALVVIAAGGAGEPWSHDLPAEGGRVQRDEDQVVAHEATHQIVAALCGAARPGGARALPFWLDEGLAEFVGGIEADAASLDDLPLDSITHGRVLLGRVASARSLRRLGIGPWTLEELVAQEDMGGLMQAGEARNPGRAPADANRWFYDAWAVVHFLWYYDDGRYRAGFRRFLGHAIGGGTADAPALRRALGASDAADSEPLTTEMDFYSNLLLRRISGRRPDDPSAWYEPSTAPPAEVFDADAADADYDE